MKTIIITLGISICFIFKTSAQISQGGEPQFWKENLSKSNQIPTEKLAKVNHKKLISEDNEELNKGVPLRFAYPHKVKFNPKNSGKWFTNTNGDKFWIFIVESQDAKSLNFTFSDFHLPQGAKLFFYNSDRTDVRGAFTSANNKISRQLGISPIKGDKVIIEYYQPHYVEEEPALQMATIAHDYRGIFNMARAYGDSGSCNNNVACSVGNNWRDQIRSVALITLADGSRFCTGALINNTANDSTPYFLTANHCTGSSTANWVFVFNYQSVGCNNTDGQLNQSVSGSQLLKKGVATDYSLLRLSSTPPASYNVYYAGWDATGQQPANTAGIHHPSGDIKKISFDNDAPSLGTFNGVGNNTHWKVNDWDDGTTEPGSSGSPLFDQNKRIIGQLHGGGAACGNNESDLYGRFDLSFPNLSQWLASGSSITQIDGFDPSGGNPDPDVQTPFNGIPGEIPGTIEAENFDNGGQGVAYSDSNSANNGPNIARENEGVDIEARDGGINVGWIVAGEWLEYTVNATTGTYDLEARIATTAGGKSIVAKLDNATISTFSNLPNTGGWGNFQTIKIPNVSVAGGTGKILRLEFPSTGLNLNWVRFASSGGGGGDCIDTQFTLNFDDYPEETSWEIKNSSGNTVDSGGPYPTQGDGSTLNINLCLPAACYTLTVNDTFGDGMCCTYGNGSYQLSSASGILASGDSFGLSENKNFCLNGNKSEIVSKEIEEEKGTIKLYPNPVNSILKVKHNLKVTSSLIFEIIDITGRKVLHKEIDNVKNILTLNVNTLPQGSYFLKIKGDNISITKRFIISK